MMRDLAAIFGAFVAIVSIAAFAAILIARWLEGDRS